MSPCCFTHVAAPTPTQPLSFPKAPCEEVKFLCSALQLQLDPTQRPGRPKPSASSPAGRSGDLFSVLTCTEFVLVCSAAWQVIQHLMRHLLTSKHLMGKDVLGHWNPQTSKAMATSVLEKMKSKFKPEPDNGFCNITSHCWNNAKKNEFSWREKNQENKGDTRAASTHYQQHQTYKYQHFSFAFKVFCTIPVFKNQPQTRLAVLDGHGGLLLERESRSKNIFCLQPNSQPFWLFSLIDISNVSCATLSLPTISQSTDMLEQWTSKVIATNTLHRFLGIFKGRK